MEVRFRKLYYLMAWVCLLHTSVCLLSVKDQHLVRCVTNIALRHFVPGRTVLLSKPADMDTELKTELLMHLHQTSLWPVVLDPEEYKSTEPHDSTKFVHPRGGFIIYQRIPCGSVRILFTELREQFITLRLMNLFTHPPWDCKAKFLIIAHSVCRNVDTKRILKMIFFYLRHERIFNSITIIKNDDLTDNAVTKYFEVYAEFLYQKPNVCSYHYAIPTTEDIALIDTWVLEGVGRFIYNTNLFPERNYRNLQGCPLRAIIRHTHPFVNANFSEGGQLTRAWGLEIDLFELIATELNATVQYHDNVPSFNCLNQRWRDTALEIIERRADVVFGSIDLQTIPFLEGTNAYSFSCWRWYVPCGIKSSRIERIFKILTPNLWIVTAVTMVLVAFVMVYLAKKAPAECQTYKTVGSSLTEVLAVILGVSVSSMPRTPPLRVFFICWVFFCLSFNTVFLSYLTTYMIDPGYEPQIQNMDELLASDLKLVHPHFANISGILSQDLSSRSIVQTGQNVHNFLVGHRHVSLLATEFYVNYLIEMGNVTDENGVRTFCSLEDGIWNYVGMRMYAYTRHDLINQMNSVIERIVESGIFNHWHDLYKNRVRSRLHVESELNPLGQYYSYNMTPLSPPFILLLTGYGLGLLMLVVELLYHRYLLPYLSVSRMMLIVRKFTSKGSRRCIAPFLNRITPVFRHIGVWCTRK